MTQGAAIGEVFRPRLSSWNDLDALELPDLSVFSYYAEAPRLGTEEKQKCRCAHSFGMKVIQHSCGFLTELIDDLCGAGIDCLQFDQPDVYDAKNYPDLPSIGVSEKCDAWAYQALVANGRRV